MKWLSSRLDVARLWRVNERNVWWVMGPRFKNQINRFRWKCNHQPVKVTSPVKMRKRWNYPTTRFEIWEHCIWWRKRVETTSPYKAPVWAKQKRLISFSNDNLTRVKSLMLSWMKAQSTTSTQATQVTCQSFPTTSSETQVCDSSNECLKYKDSKRAMTWYNLTCHRHGSRLKLRSMTYKYNTQRLNLSKVMAH